VRPALTSARQMAARIANLRMFFSLRPLEGYDVFKYLFTSAVTRALSAGSGLNENWSKIYFFRL